MRKFKKQQETQTEDLFEGLFDDEEVLEDKKEQERRQKEEEKNLPNGLPVVLERVEAGLIGSYKIPDDMNWPIIKKDDILQLRKPNRLLKRDFVLYKMQDDYYIRRIIKFKEYDIYVAGDNEREYHIVHKEDIIAKAVARERGKKFLSFSLKNTRKWYTFNKVNLAFIRCGNRVTSYETDQSAEALEAAMQKISIETQRQELRAETPVFNTQGIDLDTDLADFLDPDELVRELRQGASPVARQEAVEEEVVYVDENGEEIEYVEVEEGSEEAQEYEEEEAEESLEDEESEEE